MTSISSWVPALFFLSIAFTLWYFYKVNGKPFKLVLTLVVYALVQSLLAAYGFYIVTEPTPPRFLFVLLPLISVIILGLLPQGRKWFFQFRDIRRSTFIHGVRIPVEIVLHQLFLAGAIPELMTFEGRNFDILVGISAPIVGFFYLKGFLGDKSLLAWNIVGLFFVMFIVVNAVLSLPTPIQQFAFDQPNMAVLYFPYVLLPVLVVPIVIYTHLSDIIILLKRLRS